MGATERHWKLQVESGPRKRYLRLGSLRARLIPEQTELLYGFVYHKMSKSPLHSFLVQWM